MKSLSHVRLLVIPWTAAHQAPPSMGFSRQEYWSGVPLPSPEQALDTKLRDQGDFPGGSDGKVSVYNVGDPGSTSGWGRSPGEGNDNPLQYSCLENPMDRETW